MDACDAASELEQMQRDHALARHAHAPAGNWRRLSAKFCVEDHCAARIPDERRRAIPGVTRCVDCQTMIEQRTTNNQQRTTGLK